MDRKLVFGLRRAKGFSSRLIEWFGAGGFSHAEVMDQQGWWWSARSEACWVDKFYYPKGFWSRPPNYCKDELWIFTVEVSEEEYTKFWAFVKLQEGKPYDWLAILHFGLRWLRLKRNWRDPSSWFCSEVMAAACESAGVFEKLFKRFVSVTPGDFALLLVGRKAKYYKVNVA